MVNLAYTAEEKELRATGATIMAEMPEYPYGTCLCLNSELIAKLGVDHTDWKVGDEFELDITVKVKSLSEGSAELQITDIGAEEAEPEEESNEPDLTPYGYKRSKA